MVAVVGTVACTAGHDIGVDIDWVDRIWDSHFEVIGKDLLDVGGIAFCAITHKDFIGRDISAYGLEVIFGNSFAQEVVTLLRTITTEARFNSKFIDSFM